MISKNILSDAGLTNEQSVVYLYLLETGFSTAKHLAQKAGIGRALTYKVLKQLVDLNLVEKRDDIGKISKFFPKHPKVIKELLHSKKAELDRASDTLGQVFGELTSDFNLLLGKPNVQFFEGHDGIKKVYADILETNKDISVISSASDKGETLHLIREQIKKQVAQNIRTRAITPIGHEHELSHSPEDDAKLLVERKKVSAEKLNIPAQIIMYENKVAITNFKEEFITVVIESAYIYQTMQTLFDYVWNHTAEKS
ncbi:MAG: helix-turn-helix domain-containing protein [Patescibacteria group bacterium]